MSDDAAPSPAQLFEEFFGPSIFEPWTRVLLDYADPQPGERVLDLACATGIVARRVAPRVGGDDVDGADARVVGVDLSPGMLDVARERAASEGVAIEWREGDAAELDLPDDAFDLVLCQQGLQFFDDPVGALREAERVLDDGGRIALNVWRPLPHHPLYEALLEAEARHLDEPIEDVATPFLFGDEHRLRDVLRDAGFDRIEVDRRTLEVEFDQPERFVTLTVLAAAAVLPELALDDPEQRDALIDAISRDSADVIRQYQDGGRLRFPTPNLIGVAYA